uniref:Uncharacterized protein n=1 Tax=Anguilla anguilla TaxID=7936 RepID=A0A0E9W239_ANGAN
MNQRWAQIYVLIKYFSKKKTVEKVGLNKSKL